MEIGDKKESSCHNWICQKRTTWRNSQMTGLAVSVIITVKAGEVSETIEKDISVMDMESELNEVFQSGQQQVTAMIFDLLEAQL